MSKPLDDAYFTWLYGQVASLNTRPKSRTYWTLLRQLFTTEFVWLIPKDDNRAEDGRILRQVFMDEMHLDDDPEWLALECSFLEMLIALSRRLAFEAEGEPRDWFWHLMQNLSLEHYTDAFTNDFTKKDIDEIVARVVWRRYQPNGHGGLFPLTEARNDQREVELWYQLSAYLLERE